MAKDVKIVRRAFNAGEVSRRFCWRNDTEKHGFACERLENFYVSLLGSISRREGTRLLAVLGSDDESERLIPFEYNRELSYVLALRAGSNIVEKITYTLNPPFFSGTYTYRDFTLCLTLPANFKREGVIFKAGDAYPWTLSYTDGKIVLDYEYRDLHLELPFEEKEQPQRVSITQTYGGNSSNGLVRIQIDEDGEVSAAPFVPPLASFTSIITFYPLQIGDMMDAKLLNFSITRPSAPWNMRDYVNGVSEMDKLTKLPQWERAYSTYGSSVSYEDGIISLFPADWEAAKAKHVAEGGSSGVTELYDDIFVSFVVLPRIKITATAGADFICEDSQIDTFANYSSGYQEFVRILYRSGGQVQEVYSPGYESAEGLRIRVRLTPTGTPQLEGALDIRAEYESPLSSKSGEWASSNITLMDVFDVGGNKVQADLRTPIPPEILEEVQFSQVNGNVYFAHEKLPPQLLTYNDGLFSWKNAVTFEPSLDVAQSGVAAALSLDSGATQNSYIMLQGESGTMTTDAEFFSASMLGEQLMAEYDAERTMTFKWPYLKSNNKLSDGYYVGKSTPLFTSAGKVSIRPEGGQWDGVLALEESIDGAATWTEIGRTTSIQGSSNEAFEREIYSTNSILRVRLLSQNKVTSTTASTVESHKEGVFFNVVIDAYQKGWLKVSAVNSPTSAIVEAVSPLTKAETRRVFSNGKLYRSAWGASFGYPRCVEIHEERLTLGGTRRNPSTIWLSQTNNWDNFRSVSNLDTDPLAYTLASDDGEPISWLVSKSDLMIGLGNCEWSFGSRNEGEALTSSIVHASNESEDGVEYIAPAKAGSMVIYVRRGNRELGSLGYDFAGDSYNSTSLTTMNPEILGDGVSAIFNQLSPKNMIFAVRKDGVLPVFTFDKENNVAAWSRFTFGDGVMSACALSTGGFKSVFLIVRRGGHLCLERLDPNEMGTGNWKDCAPISAGVEIPEGLQTSVPYESHVKTTPFFNDGNVRIIAVELLMLGSYGGEYRITGWSSDGEKIDFADDWRTISSVGYGLDEAPIPQDCRFYGNVDNGYMEEASLEVRTKEAAPFELAAVAMKAGEV